MPAPHVFGDASGEIASLEAAAKEQAARAAGGEGGGEGEEGANARLELLKLLHVSVPENGCLLLAAAVCGSCCLVGWGNGFAASGRCTLTPRSPNLAQTAPTDACC